MSDKTQNYGLFWCLRWSVLLLCLTVCTATTGLAQEQPLRPAIRIAAINETIPIESDFSGTDVYVVAILENIDTLKLRQNLYDVVIVLEGPEESVILRQKKRHFGVWVNADSITFDRVPLYYAMTSTKQWQDIADAATYKRLALGLENIPLDNNSDDPEHVALFRSELIDLQANRHLYSRHAGDVEAILPAVYKVKFSLPANVPVGSYKVRALLFSEGQFLDTALSDIRIAKAHMAYEIYRAAHVHSLWYGFAAVFIAIFIGFTGRVIFRKD